MPHAPSIDAAGRLVSAHICTNPTRAQGIYLNRAVREFPRQHTGQRIEPHLEGILCLTRLTRRTGAVSFGACDERVHHLRQSVAG